MVREAPGGASEWLLDTGPAHRLDVLLWSRALQILSDRPCHPEYCGVRELHAAFTAILIQDEFYTHGKIILKYLKHINRIRYLDTY